MHRSRSEFVFNSDFLAFLRALLFVMAGIAAGNPPLTVVVTMAPGPTPDAPVSFPAISPIGQMLAAMFTADIAVRHAADVANNLPARISLAQWVVARLFLARCTFSDDFPIHPAKPHL